MVLVPDKSLCTLACLPVLFPKTVVFRFSLKTPHTSRIDDFRPSLTGTGDCSLSRSPSDYCVYSSTGKSHVSTMDIVTDHIKEEGFSLLLMVSVDFRISSK